MTVLERFTAKTHVGGVDDCWPWTGARDGHGYGYLWRDGRLRRAARLAYELFVGPIPEGLQIDHLCRNRACVNPAHLEPVTQQENIRRGEGGAHWRNKTHCPQGHPYDEANTSFTHGRKPQRRCRACMRESSRRAYWRAKERRAA